MDLRGYNGLLIDDMPEMRSTVRIQLTDAGLERCDVARNVKEAIEKISANRYDLVICDYNLGQGADGQQLLELVRRKQVLPLATAFLMITAESAYAQVATAAEYSPDDYLIKPFTAETLRSRLTRILERKEALKPIYLHMGPKGDKEQALAACLKLLNENTRYSLDVMRIKGDLLLVLNRPNEALALYQSVLDQRSTPWAEVGKARTSAAAGNTDEAQAELWQALEAYPNYLAAYDALSQLLEQSDKAAAQEVVEKALKVAPSTQRQRQLGGLALDNKDFARAETAFRRAVEKDRTGFFKSHDDYAGLAKSCSAQGKTQEALIAVKEMSEHFAPTPELIARQAAVESLVQTKAGNVEAAKSALQRALEVRSKAALNPSSALEIAGACFASGDTDLAKAIIQSVAEDHQENDQVIAAAQSVFQAAGRGDEGSEFLETTRRNMIQLNNEAVALARSGELEQAISMLQSAADRLTNNAQVSINAALALLLDCQRNGLKPERLAQAHGYLLQARAANPLHARLVDVVGLYRRLAPPNAPSLE